MLKAVRPDFGFWVGFSHQNVKLNNSYISAQPKSQNQVVVGFGGGVTTYNSKSNVFTSGKRYCTLSGGGFGGGATTYESKSNLTTCAEHSCTLSCEKFGSGAVFEHFDAES